MSNFQALSENKLQFQNNQRPGHQYSGEKTRKLDTLAKLFQAMRSKPVSWQRLSDNFQLDHHAGLKKNCADELWKLARANATLHLLTQKSEINLKLFPQACIYNKLRGV